MGGIDELLQDPFKKSERPAPTFADLKEKGIEWNTNYFNLLSSDDFNNFIATMERVANNPHRYYFGSFETMNQVDGSPFILLRLKVDTKVEEIKHRNVCIWGRIFNTKQLNELDEVINKYDRTKVFLLWERRIFMKNGDVFFMLIWATVEKVVRNMEGLSELRRIFSVQGSN